MQDERSALFRAKMSHFGRCAWGLTLIIVAKYGSEFRYLHGVSAIFSKISGCGCIKL